MAQKLALFVAFAIFQAIVFAEDYIVGDEMGWSTGVSYEDWAEGKMFLVGDTITFNYPQGQHNVVKVDGSGFKKCQEEPNNGTLTSGADKITLATPGNKWYICSVGYHCESGQKLKITVYESMAPSPALEPMPWPMPEPAPAPAPWY
ncbi:mavicyanin [Amborella trichopoda]|uniref:Phytocyanin domain-containing protein n=1 Tax=Amborella trichopoda TaxID=13333 RepID=W1NDZ1_AMBTC|nr:mavicyanin [Amborella trichopoda]ERM93586.1 hypothetical protein AMTR_s00004p00119400 [Amborella trichopoda]|eukprot:XP_006826349.1 mavicyanin [Amborella trichopoda]